MIKHSINYMRACCFAKSPSRWASALCQDPWISNYATVSTAHTSSASSPLKKAWPKPPPTTAVLQPLEVLKKYWGYTQFRWVTLFFDTLAFTSSPDVVSSASVHYDENMRMYTLVHM